MRKFNDKKMEYIDSLLSETICDCCGKSTKSSDANWSEKPNIDIYINVCMEKKIYISSNAYEHQIDRIDFCPSCFFSIMKEYRKNL